MTWRKRKDEEMEELERFVESMKRGQTVATGDSLLETLRQIHDRRESPVVAHDHKQMLRDRLRRQIAERDGQPVDDSVPVPVFMRPASKRRVLQWAVAASIAVHVGLGAIVLPNVGFDARVFTALVDDDASEAIVFNTTPIFLPPLSVPRDRARVEAPPSDRPESSPSQGNGRAPAIGGGVEVARIAPSPASRAIGPAVAPGVQPVIHNFSSSVEGLAAQNLPEPAGLLPSGPSLPEKIRPTSEVMVSRFDRDPDVADSWDVAPRIHYKPKPLYPDKALEYKISGKVRLKVVLSADGSVREVNVVRGLGYGLSEAAVDAARRIKFTPATRNGVPVSARVMIDVEFEIR